MLWWKPSSESNVLVVNGGRLNELMHASQSVAFHFGGF